MQGAMQARAAAGARMGAMDAWSHGIPAALVPFVQRTYGLLTFSLLLAAAACWATIQWMPLREVVLRDGSSGVVSAFPRWGLWLLWGGTMVFGFLGNRARGGARQGEASVAGLVFLSLMVICAGAMLGPTIGTFVGVGMTNVVLAAAVTTAATFGGLTAYVLLTGRNFSFLQGALFMAFLAFFVAWMVGAFFIRSPEFQWWLAAVGALIISGMILVDTSSVIHFYGPNNMVVPAVIALFIDLLNLFILLLTLFAGRRDR